MNIWADLMQVRGLHLAIFHGRLFVMPVHVGPRNSPGSRMPGRNRRHRVEARIYQEDHNGDCDCVDYYQDVKDYVEDGELNL